jgi:hypothetical protein
MKTRLHTGVISSAKRTLETVILVNVFSLLLILFSCTGAFADSTIFEEGPNIDDIPPNTETVVNALTNPEFDFEDEAYINDIPFNTTFVVVNYKYTIATAAIFELEAETYIDDMPFDTFIIANNCNKVNSPELIASEIQQDELSCNLVCSFLLFQDSAISKQRIDANQSHK